MIRIRPAIVETLSQLSPQEGERQMKINFGRVLLGGLVAGVILTIGEWLLNGVVLHKEMEEFFKKCGFRSRATNSW